MEFFNVNELIAANTSVSGQIVKGINDVKKPLDPIRIERIKSIIFNIEKPENLNTKDKKLGEQLKMR